MLLLLGLDSDSRCSNLKCESPRPSWWDKFQEELQQRIVAEREQEEIRRAKEARDAHDIAVLREQVGRMCSRYTRIVVERKLKPLLACCASLDSWKHPMRWPQQRQRKRINRVSWFMKPGKN